MRPGGAPVGQGNRVLSEEDFEQVVLIPTGVETFALDACFQLSLVFQQVVSVVVAAWLAAMLPCRNNHLSRSERPMITFNCTIQEGIVPEDIRPRLAAELARISTGFVGGNPDEVLVNWIEIPHGFGFRGGRLSTTSAVRGEIPPGLQQETRVELMQSIQDMWMDVTGCTTDELVVSARDRRDT